MAAPRIVFLDTNIYDGIQYNFDSKRLKALVEMVPEHVSHLLLPESIQDEICRHINQDCEKIVDGIQSAQKKAGFVTKLPYWPEHKDLKSDVEKMKVEVRGELELFLKRLKVVRLKYEANDVREVMGWYDKLKAPFNEAKDQIADALAIQALLLHSRERNEAPIALVSNDEHMAAACVGRKNLVLYKTLDQFLDDINEAEDFVKKIKSGLEKQSFAGLLELVNESFADLYFTHDDDENARVTNPRVLSVTPYNFLVVDGDEKTWCDISMTVEIVYVAHVRIGDLDSVSRDSETRTTFFNHWLKGDVSETIDLKGILNCHIDPNTQEITKMRSFTFDDDMVIISERPPEEEDDYYQPYRDQGLIP
jgi:PIN domain